MESRKVPALLALVGVVLAVALFLLLKDDTADEDATIPPPQQSATGEGPGEGKDGQKATEPKPPKPEVPVIEIKGGQPVGGVQELEFKVGDEVEIEIRSDTAEEVHLHGYDLTVPIPAGKPQTLVFEATIDGGYALESHVTGASLANVSILPD